MILVAHPPSPQLGDLWAQCGLLELRRQSRWMSRVPYWKKKKRNSIQGKIMKNVLFKIYVIYFQVIHPLPLEVV